MPTAAAAALLLATACAGGGEAEVPDGRRVLEAQHPTVGLEPGQSGTVTFVLRSDAVAIGGQTVNFSIVDPEVAQGATLAMSSAVTNATGAASVVVTAPGRETQFQVRAKSLAAEADTLIIVAVGAKGKVVAVPFFGPSSLHAKNTNSIAVRLLDGRVCRDIVPAHPPAVMRKDELVAAAGGPTEPFDLVKVNESSAIVARAIGADNQVVAAGCVDVAGASLLADNIVNVPIRLDDVIPDPIGSFEVTSTFTPTPALPAAVALAATWGDLADCPLDPAQLLLDCTIDALSAPSAADPLDCVPAAAAGAETALGDALRARRGVIITDVAGGTSNCRGSTDGQGAISLEATVLGLYGTPLPTQIASLPAVANDAAHILDTFSLGSLLEVRPGVASSSLLFTHLLVSAEFGPATDPVAVTLGPLGLPVLEAHATGRRQDDEIVIDGHGFTLHLGTVAKSAFYALGLGRRGLPGDAAGLIGQVAALAHSGDGAASGCAAIDGALCGRVSAPAGCVIAACNAGLGALAARLAGAFDDVDGTGLDLYLAGDVLPIDTQGEGLANQLGSPEKDPVTKKPKLGSWTGEVQTRLGRSAITGTFEGSRRTAQ